MAHDRARPPRWLPALALALVTLAPLLAAGCGGTPTAPLAPVATTCTARALKPAANGQSPFVGRDGTRLVFHGQPLTLAGFTMYASEQGASAIWHSSGFTRYADSVLALGAQIGQNLVRPTDYWSASASGQTAADATLWSNMDYLVRAASQCGFFVVMDLSAYKWLLMSQGLDPYDPANWSGFLAQVAARYRNEPAIAFYSIVGEPPVPQTPEDMARLVAFYAAVTSDLRTADGGHHLIAAGGFNHMEDETPATQWWQAIYALPDNDLVAFKTYSQHDLDLMPTIAAYAQQIGKPLVDEEFGMPQSLGDGAFSGTASNGVGVSRAAFYAEVYAQGRQLAFATFIFWNLGCQQRASSFDVSPATPAVWIAIQHAAPAPIVPPAGGDPLCG